MSDRCANSEALAAKERQDMLEDQGYDNDLQFGLQAWEEPDSDSVDTLLCLMDGEFKEVAEYLYEMCKGFKSGAVITPKMYAAFSALKQTLAENYASIG